MGNELEQLKEVQKQLNKLREKKEVIEAKAKVEVDAIDEERATLRELRNNLVEVLAR